MCGLPGCRRGWVESVGPRGRRWLLCRSTLAGVIPSINDGSMVASVTLPSWRLCSPGLWFPSRLSRDVIIGCDVTQALELPGGKEHPAVLHLYCHLMELSGEPEVAMPAANTLRSLFPSAGHLTHMASHIDIWAGQYKVRSLGRGPSRLVVRSFGFVSRCRVSS